MLIRTKFRLAFVVSLIVIAVLSLFIGAKFMEINRLQTQVNNLRQLESQVSSLLSTTYHLVYFHPERTTKQWQTLYSNCLELTGKLISDQVEQKQRLTIIRNELEHLNTVFYQFLKNNPDWKNVTLMERSRTEDGRHQASLLNERTITLLFAKSETINHDIMVAQSESLQAIDVIWRNFKVLMILSILFSWLVLVLLGHFMGKELLLPLSLLHEGVEKIRNGQLQTRLAWPKKNEVGYIMAAFNGMAANLQNFQATLEREVKKRTLELQQSNEQLQQFAYIASHDLQEPLRSISGYLKLLSTRYSELLPDEDKRFIERPIKATQRMQSLIQGLLAFSRIGTSNTPAGPVDCSLLIDSLCEDLSQLIEETGATVNYAQLPIVMAESRQLSQVFQNLIVNAIKFRGAEPIVISITAERIQSKLEQSEEFWQFTVQDNGIGFDMQFVHKIFLIFQRLHTTTEYPGTGIGLAMCRKIIERHGGTIWADSAKGKGSSFFFTLPVNDVGTLS